jgi:hypothetical protein
MRDDELRPVWTSLPITHSSSLCLPLLSHASLSECGGGSQGPSVCVCVFITAVPITKLLGWGDGDSGGHVLRETTSHFKFESQKSFLRSSAGSCVVN